MWRNVQDNSQCRRYYFAHFFKCQISMSMFWIFLLQVHIWTSSPVSKLEFWNLEEKLVLGCIPLLGLDLLHVTSLNMPLNDNNKCSSNISVENLCIMPASTFSVWQKMTDDNDIFHKWRSCIHLFFCGNWSGNDALMWCYFACSLKKEDVGYCRKLSWVRGSALFAEREGENKWWWWQKCGHH